MDTEETGGGWQLTLYRTMHFVLGVVEDSVRTNRFCGSKNIRTVVGDLIACSLDLLLVPYYY